MSGIDPNNIDGIDHINVYSKGVTELGRLLSNFAYTPFTGGPHTFASVEGWWQWYCTGKQHYDLKTLYGIRAKSAGKQYTRTQTPTKEVLFKVYCCKIECNPEIRTMLIQSTLPFTHYYNYGGKIVHTQWEWTGSLWNEVRDHYQVIDKIFHK